MSSLKLRKLHDAVGATFPADLLARLKVGEGDVPHVLEMPDGLLLTPHDPGSPRQMEAARRVMAQRRAVLRQLAK